MRAIRFSGFILLAITVLAFILRFTGLGFGLPYAESRPDELLIITPAMKYGTGDLNPHSFYYPSLLSYLLFILYGVYAVILKVSGQIHSFKEILLQFAEDPKPFFLLSRSLTACLGALTVPGLYYLSRHYFSRFTSLVAAGMLAVTYLHVRDSHFGVTDVPMTAFVVFAMIAVARIQGLGRRQDYLLAGVLAGLATSMKYNAGLMALVIFTAHTLSAGMAGKTVRERMLSSNLWLAAVCMVGAFAVTSPFVFLDWPAFLKDFRYDMWLLSGEGEAKAGNAWIRHFTVTLWHGAGPLLLLAAGVGTVLLMFRRWREAVALAAFPLLYYLIVGRGYTVLVRYMMPMIPFLCLFAAVAIGEYFRGWMKRYGGEKTALVMAFLLVAVVVIVPFSRAIAFDRVLLRPDTRELAVRHVEQSFTNGAVIGWVGTRYGLPKFSETPESLRLQIEETRAGGRSGLLLEAKLKVAEKRGKGITLVQIPAGELATRDNLPNVIMVEYYPVAYSLISYGDAETVLARRGYQKEQEFSGAPRAVYDRSGMVYDIQDSFYVPYVGASRIQRPGPLLSLWRSP